MGTPPGSWTEEDIRAYRRADSASVPVLSVDDFVPSENTMRLPLGKLVVRFVFLVFLILVGATVVIEAIRFAVGG